MAEDQETGLIIYGKETDKPVNVSTPGFGSNFLKGVTISFIALIVLVTILPVVPGFSGTGSLTIGPQNSPFKFFEYNKSIDKEGKEGVAFSYFILPILYISGIVGSVYAIFTAICKKRSWL